jgi:hypothetical protein
MLRSLEFEEMGFLSYTVETYERRMMTREEEERLTSDEHFHQSSKFDQGRYLFGHPKSSTHSRFLRSDTHKFLPNIVGSWPPRRDGDESTKPFYYAWMLSLLKPWRSFHNLIDGFDNWEAEFNQYMRIATQREKDVIASCQYYYDNRSAPEKISVDEDINTDAREDDINMQGFDDDDCVQDKSSSMVVSDLL